MSSSPIIYSHQQLFPMQFLQKPLRSQYNSQTQVGLHQQQSQQFNFPPYFVSSVNIQPDNLIKRQKCESIPVISYFANQSNSKSLVLSHNFNDKSSDESQYNSYNNGTFNEVSQPKYSMSNSNFVPPGELSLTCFTLTNWIEQFYPIIIRTDSIPDYLPLPIQSQSVYNYYRDYSTLEFINIIEAVPDILKNIRPGNFIFTSTLISVSIGRNETFSQRSADNLITKLKRPSSTSEYSISINPQWSVLLKATRTTNNNYELQNNLLIKNNCDYELEIINEQLKTSSHKTYAGILQDNMKFQCDKMKVIKGMHEINSATEATSGPQKKIIKPNKNDLDKDEVISSSDENEELINSTANFIARAARRTLRASSTDSGIGVDESPTKVQRHKVTKQKKTKNIDQKHFNKLAENFCFGPLTNTSFLLVFDEYSKFRRRMEYTKLLIDPIGVGNFNNIDENFNIRITNAFEQTYNYNGRTNSTVSCRQHHIQHNYQKFYNYNNSWQPQQQYRRDNYLSRRSQNRV